MEKIKNNVFKLSDIDKKKFDDRWVKFALGPQGFTGSKNLNLGIVYFAKNITSLNHKHNVDEALFVLSGKGQIKIGKKIYDAQKNDFVYVPVDTDHQIITEGSSIKILFVFGGEIKIDH